MRIKTYLYLFFASVALSTPCFAGLGINIGDKLYADGALTSQVGGPYTIHAVSPSSFSTFKTFCVEIEQSISVGFTPPKVYVVSDISTHSQPTGNSMSGYTAWLYTKYNNNALSGYADTASDRNLLQYAIWDSMGYSTSTLKTYLMTAGGYSSSQADDLKLAYDTINWLGIFNLSGWGSSNFGNVRIASLVKESNGRAAQDILVMVPTPGACALLIIGLLSIAAFRNRFVRSA